MLNSAQMMAVTTSPPGLQLATFDGDVTLYNDGQSLEADSPLVPRLLDLIVRKNVKIGIVTAAGYTEARQYYGRLHGLLDALAACPSLSSAQKQRALVVMGGEANYLFEFDPSSPYLLRPVDRPRWLTDEMAAWREADISDLLDAAEMALAGCVRALNLPAVMVRKDRAVGIVPKDPFVVLARESLEETVLVVQKILEVGMGLGLSRQQDDNGHGEALRNQTGTTVIGGSQLGNAGVLARVPFCAFNGGRDVFVDIGDKAWGVAVCQKWFGPGGGGSDVAADSGSAGVTGVGGVGGGDQNRRDSLMSSKRDSVVSSSGKHSVSMPIKPENTLHVGDQFLSAGSNDFKARNVSTTAWIASPAETVELLDELAMLMEKKLS